MNTKKGVLFLYVDTFFIEEYDFKIEQSINIETTPRRSMSLIIVHNDLTLQNRISRHADIVEPPTPVTERLSDSWLQRKGITKDQVVNIVPISKNAKKRVNQILTGLARQGHIEIIPTVEFAQTH